ncbi:MAG: protein translocase subunit SecD, partial [bacterium]|nr:protein translocase subunit SecD [bacterium]
NQALSFLHLPGLPEVPFRLGLDLKGGTHLVYEADLSRVDSGDIDFKMEGLRDVIETRVNLFGVTEPLVQIEGTGGGRRLIVELAGIQDPNQAIQLIGQTPFLEFKETKPNYQEILVRNQDVLAKGGGEYEDPFQSTRLTGAYLQKAELGFDNVSNKPMITLEFTPEGAQIFKDLTAANIGKPIAMYLDYQLLQAPVVQDVISDGKAQITGTFTIEEAKKIAGELSHGALPVPITLISQETVGSILGKVSLEQSLKAGIIGFLLVIAFMILLYRLSGFFASLTLLIYVVFMLSLFKLIPITMTLAGIGGFILTMGIAVDANILIFSRMREELKQGRTFSGAIEEGFRRAWPSIRDGNFTTLLVAVILFWFGSSFVRGFALVLALGILVSMACAMIITRIFLQTVATEKLKRFQRLII